MTEKKKIMLVECMDDEFECICRNHSHSQGLFPCDQQGNDIEPDDKWLGYWRCDRCGQIWLELWSIRHDPGCNGNPLSCDCHPDILDRGGDPAYEHQNGAMP